jgi:hypothetical protein
MVLNTEFGEPRSLSTGDNVEIVLAITNEFFSQVASNVA